MGMGVGEPRLGFIPIFVPGQDRVRSRPWIYSHICPRAEEVDLGEQMGLTWVLSWMCEQPWFKHG